jgi:hypothetical protein
MAALVSQTPVQSLQDKVLPVQSERNLLKRALIFFAGVEALHTAAAVCVGLSGTLPMNLPLFPSITISQESNLIAIVVNALVTIVSLQLAGALSED